MSYLGLNIKNMGMGTGMKETDKYTDSRRLSKESLDSAIKRLQKTIRLGAASNEYFHAGKIERNEYIHGARDAIHEIT